MKCQILFSGKNKKNISKCRLLKILPRVLSVKVPSKICCRLHSNCFVYFSEEISLDMSCESSAWQMIHMKCDDLFSLKKNK